MKVLVACFGVVRRAMGNSLETSVVERSKVSGVRRVVLAFVNSWNGFKGAFRGQAAVRQEVALAAVLIPAAVWLGDSALERALLIASVLLVLLVELINTCIETVVDRIGLEQHELSGLAKDVGSCTVLLSFAILFVVWGFLLLG